MEKKTLTAAALGIILMLAAPVSEAQNRRSSTEQNTTANPTTTTTTTTRRSSGTVTQPTETTTQTKSDNQTSTRQTTTTTRQSTPDTPTRQTTSQPSRQTTTQPTKPATSQPTTTTTTQAPGGRRNSTTTTTQPAETQPATKNGSQTSQPASQPSRNNGGATVRPGGSSTHQNSNGGPTTPNKQDPKKPQAQQKPTPGYMPNAIKSKPPKEPVFTKKPKKPLKPVEFNRHGYHMFGKKYNSIPKGHTIKYYNDVKFYISSGVFYRYSGVGGFYIVSRPPKGYSFDIYRSNVIMPPVLIDPYRDQASRIADAIALANYYSMQHPSYRRYSDSFYIDNVREQRKYIYLFEDGVYYTFERGLCTVCDAPLGAMTPILPYDYEEIYLGGNLYYLVDNIIFGVVCPEGTPYFEVFCVL